MSSNYLLTSGHSQAYHKMSDPSLCLSRRFSLKDVITAYPISLVRSCILAYSSQRIEKNESSYDKAEVVDVLIWFFSIATFKPSLFHHFEIKTSFKVCWAEPTTTCKYYMLNLQIDWVTSKDKICNHNFNYNNYQVMQLEFHIWTKTLRAENNLVTY